VYGVIWENEGPEKKGKKWVKIGQKRLKTPNFTSFITFLKNPKKPEKIQNTPKIAKI